ncbi:TetR/AcrR family transcriptional regulator [Comamonas terrigena]|uniref:TetR/AcrR family transcriptional regulator n=1 Tax=Comamonas terrigena TaxID=32013 RepID=UPI00244C68E6|nr:TetR family transcriptional regulator [Comamonas terrigena]MDH1701722.1 TetR/AcrR family transcriptional regulator [Comamonas terrigena]
MKTSKAQAQDNRAHVVQTASALFRERGYDGVSVAELMAAAGFTHGGFYKQFRSKADLMAESAACGMAQTAALAASMDRPTFVRSYLSRAHRDTRAVGCTMAALGADAARQPKAVRAAFAEGIEHLLQALEKELPAPEQTGLGAPGEIGEVRTHAIDTLAHAVGALVLSRVCPDDSPLADEILSVCRDQMLRKLAATPPKPPKSPPSKTRSVAVRAWEPR